jgi:integrase
MKLLKRRWQEVGRGRFIGPAEDRVTLEDLLKTLEDDYAVNQRRSARNLTYRLRHLRAAFGDMRAIDVTEDRIERYKSQRLSEKTERGDRMVKPATVNRELAALRKAFRLAVRQKRISTAPAISLLPENNVRQGFVEPKEFELLAKALPEHLQDFSRLAYLTGCRKGELQSLAWAAVSRDAQRITIAAEYSKNKESRDLHYPAGEISEIIERRMAGPDVRERRRQRGHC